MQLLDSVGGCCRVSIEGVPMPRRGHREAANLYRPDREATDHFPDGAHGAEVLGSGSETCISSGIL